jgi:hypothetical protein
LAAPQRGSPATSDGAAGCLGCPMHLRGT